MSAVYFVHFTLTIYALCPQFNNSIELKTLTCTHTRTSIHKRIHNQYTLNRLRIANSIRPQTGCTKCTCIVWDIVHSNVSSIESSSSFCTTHTIFCKQLYSRLVFVRFAHFLIVFFSCVLCWLVCCCCCCLFLVELNVCLTFQNALRRWLNWDTWLYRWLFLYTDFAPRNEYTIKKSSDGYLRWYVFV